MTPADLAAARQRLGMTLRQFARAINLESSRTVQRWEEGSRDIPGPIALIINLAQIYPDVRRHLEERAR